MASVSPLYVDSSNNLVEMTSAEIVEVQNRMIYAYSQGITAVLTQVSGSGANINSMDDTRTSAGAVSQNASAFVAEPVVVLWSNAFCSSDTLLKSK